MDTLLALVSKVPTVLWIIIGVCVVLPFVWGCIKKARKGLGYVAVALALLFMFPSIGSSFMDRVGLTWDSESKSLINRNGTEISFGDIIDKGKDVKDLIGNIDEAKKQFSSVVSEVEDITNSLNKDLSNISNKITVDNNMIEAAKQIGLSINTESVIAKIGDCYYLILNNENKIELSSDIVKALGIE